LNWWWFQWTLQDRKEKNEKKKIMFPLWFKLNILKKKEIENTVEMEGKENNENIFKIFYQITCVYSVWFNPIYYVWAEDRKSVYEIVIGFACPSRYFLKIGSMMQWSATQCIQAWIKQGFFYLVLYVWFHNFAWIVPVGVDSWKEEGG
jgi:hypothetical protein